MCDDRRWIAGFLLAIFMSVEQSYNKELRVIPSYKRLKWSDWLDGNENSMFRCPLGLLDQNFRRPLDNSLEC